MNWHTLQNMKEKNAIIKEQANRITELETALKAAEDHAATMEGCAKVAERVAMGASDSNLAIEAMFNQDFIIEGLKKQLADRFPFKVFKNSARKRDDNYCYEKCNYAFTHNCTKDNCPLIPKGEHNDTT